MMCVSGIHAKIHNEWQKEYTGHSEGVCSRELWHLSFSIIYNIRAEDCFMSMGISWQILLLRFTDFTKYPSCKKNSNLDTKIIHI
jgi:hypothetical protein